MGGGTQCIVSAVHVTYAGTLTREPDNVSVTHSSRTTGAVRTAVSVALVDTVFVTQQVCLRRNRATNVT